MREATFEDLIGALKRLGIPHDIIADEDDYGVYDWMVVIPFRDLTLEKVKPILKRMIARESGWAEDDPRWKEDEDTWYFLSRVE